MVLLKTIKNKDMEIYINADLLGYPAPLNSQYELTIDKVKGEYITLLMDWDG